MTDLIEDLITEQLRGEAEYDKDQLLRLARTEIQNLRAKNTDLGWAIDFHRDRAEELEQRGAW